MAAEKNTFEKKQNADDQQRTHNPLDALLQKENALAEGKNQDLVNNLLEKCEVKSFSEIYVKTVAENDGIFSQKKLFNFNNVFTVEKVRNDITAIPDLLLVSLIDPKPLKKELSYQKRQVAVISMNNNKEKIESGKELYIINKEGLKRILNLYRKRRIFSPILKISDIMTEFELDNHKLPILTQMITELIEEKQIYADLLLGDCEDGKENHLIFKNKLSDPENRKRLLTIFLLSGLLFLALTFYQMIISMFSSQ